MTTSLETQQRILDAVAKWSPRLGLQDWAIHVSFDGEAPNEDDSMWAKPRSLYQSITIGVCPDIEEREFGYFTVEKCVLHELVHCHVSGRRGQLWEVLCQTSMRADERNILWAMICANEEEMTTSWCHLLWKAYETSPWATPQTLSSKEGKE